MEEVTDPVAMEGEPATTVRPEDAPATTPIDVENAEGSERSTEEVSDPVALEVQPTTSVTPEDAPATTPIDVVNAEGAEGSMEEVTDPVALEEAPATSATPEDAPATTPIDVVNAEGAEGCTEAMSDPAALEAEPATSVTPVDVPATTLVQELDDKIDQGHVLDASANLSSSAPERTEFPPAQESEDSSTESTFLLSKEIGHVTPIEAINVDAMSSVQEDESILKASQEPQSSNAPKKSQESEQEGDAPVLDLEAESVGNFINLLATSESAITAAEASLPALHQEYVNSTAFTEEVTWRMRNLAHPGNSAASDSPPVHFEACVPMVQGLFGNSSGSDLTDQESLDTQLVSFVQAFDIDESGMLEMPEFALFLRWFYAVAFAEENSDYAGSL